jgi:hypothetical protein
MSFLQPRRRTALYAVLCACLLFGSLRPTLVDAAELQNRSLTLSTVIPGATATDQFTFDYASTSPVGSLLFEYCDDPLEADPCNAPPGLNVSNATLQDQTGETGFSVLSTTTNSIALTRSPSEATGGEMSDYTFSGAVNPTGAPTEFYARIYTYSSTGAQGPITDFGAVAVDTIEPGVSINTTVPPILDFCVGQTITGDDCSTTSGSVVDLGNLTPNSASSGTSQMVVGTNAQFGIVITANGTTMTSGNNDIPSLPTPTVSAPGNSQFGFNLRANTNPQVGQDPDGPGVANPTANYDIPNKFVFNPGDVVATSPAVTDLRKFTVSYIANVSPGQSAGVYTATVTYICTASF